MSQNKIAYIIPHRGRDDILLWHLKELNQQSCKDLAVFVMYDGSEGEMNEKGEVPFHNLKREIDKLPLNYERHYHPSTDISSQRGPAKARNKGAQLAYEMGCPILLFVGSDTIPSPELIAKHYQIHTEMEPHIQIVQGYSPWHKDVTSGLTDFIDRTGFQAAWENAQDKNGDW